MKTAQPRPLKPPLSLKDRLREIRRGFEPAFWVANITELFERLAYYAQAAVLAIFLSLVSGSWFFAAPTGTLLVSGHGDQVAMLMIVVVGFGIALLSRSQ